ncbi:MAG: hypothetical protein RL418_78 [Actinomycetota bacterium]
MSNEDLKSVASKVFAIFNTFDAQNRHQRLSTISKRSGLPLTSTHRLVNELVEQGALVRTLDGAYEIASKMWNLGILASLHADLRELALPYMEDVYQISNDAVQIGVLDGLRCLIVERIAGSRTLEVVSKPGARLPLHASGVGKVLLAYGGAELQEASFKTLERFTPTTITKAEEIQSQLEKVRQTGFAVSVEELAAGASSIAVPIRGLGHRVVAALGIVSPAGSLDVNRMVPILRVTAQALGRKLVASGITDSISIR